MRILITGGAGFIGSHTADLLLTQNHTVRILDGLMPPVHADGQLPGYVPQRDVEFVHGDIRCRENWERALQDIDIVFHLAAYQDYLPDFSTFYHTNTVPTALLYEIIVEKRLSVQKVIIASSQAVYGEGKYICRQEGVCYPSWREESALKRGEWDIKCPRCGGSMDPVWTDETVINPHSQYGISKYTQEMVALNIGRRYGIPTVCMRYSIVQGPRQSFRNAYSGVLRIFTQRLLCGKPPVCYEDGGQLRDYVSVFDAARANVLVMYDARADFQVFNVGGNHHLSVLEYAHLIARRAGVAIDPQIPGRYRVGDTRHIFSDVTKLRGLGWTPTVNLEEIVDEYIAWAQGQPGFRDYSVEAEERMSKLGTIREVM